MTMTQSAFSDAFSPLIWFGGKSKMAKNLINLMPPHGCFVDLFGGAAHVITQKAPIQTEVYNDIDGLVLNFLMVVREDKTKFIKAVDSLPYSRKLYETWKEEPWPEDDFARAVRWFYLNRSGIAKGNADKKTGWRHAKSPGSSPAPAYYASIDRISAFSHRMKKVQLECRDFREIIKIYDGTETLFYVDPPYIGREKYYAGGFTGQDHHDLADMLNRVQGLNSNH